MKMAKVLSLIMAFALCLGLFTGCGANNYTAKNTEYVIGLSGLSPAAPLYMVLQFRTPLRWLLTRSTLPAV